MNTYTKLFSIIILLFSMAAHADIQDKRYDFIQGLINNGVFKKVETTSSLPYLWVKPAFYRLSFDDKSKFVNVVYAYYYTKNSKYNMVVLYDSKTGKKAGTYNPSIGGLHLK